MHRMSRSVAVASAFVTLLLGDCATAEHQTGTVVVVPNEDYFAARVFVGREDEMPVDGLHYVAIEPTHTESGYLIPPTALAALKELRHFLPPWYLNALVRGKGGHSCSVFVDEGEHTSVDFGTFVEAWYWKHWKLDDESSPLQGDFRRMNLQDKLLILSALRFGLCKLLKTGSEREALATMEGYSDLTR